MTTENSKLTISLDSILRVIEIGVQRALCFNKIALSAEYSTESFNNYKNSSSNVILQMHPALNDTDLPVNKELYFRWTALNGLREIVESFYIFVDELEIALSIFSAQSNKPLSTKEIEQTRESVKNQKKSLNERFKALKKQYNLNIEHDYFLHFLFLEQMRHCLSHNLGLVTKKYFDRKVNGKDAAQVEWLELILTTEIEPSKFKRYNLGKATSGGIYLSITKYKKDLPYNQPMQITFSELEMIAFTTLNIAKNFSSEADIAIRKMLNNTPTENTKKGTVNENATSD